MVINYANLQSFSLGIEVATATNYHAWNFGEKELMKDNVSMNAEGFI